MDKMNGNYQQTKDGKWIEATPEPYYPSVIESLLHWFGKHVWSGKGCLICGISASPHDGKEQGK